MPNIAPVVRDALGWGFLLWLMGYGLGILLLTVVPISLIGWIITPIGTGINSSLMHVI